MQGAPKVRAALIQWPPARASPECLKIENRPKMHSRPSCLTVVALSSMLLLLSSCSGGKPTTAKANSSGDQEKPVRVKLFAVESREVQRTVEAVGSLFAYDEVAVSSEVDGRAEKVLVDVGDHVTKGQTLVEVLPIEFKLAADQQQAIVEQAIAKLGLTESEAETIDPKQT